MANKDEPHEIERIIAKRNLADATKATAAADAKRETQQLSARVKEYSLPLKRPFGSRSKKRTKLSSEAGKPRNFGTSPLHSRARATYRRPI